MPSHRPELVHQWCSENRRALSSRLPSSWSAPALTAKLSQPRAEEITVKHETNRSYLLLKAKEHRNLNTIIQTFVVFKAPKTSNEEVLTLLISDYYY